jgi:cell wall-associated NlpC family hydrolase
MQIHRASLLAAALSVLPALAKASPPKKAEAPAPARGSYALLPAQLKDKYLNMSFKADGGEQVDFKLERLQYQNPHTDALVRDRPPPGWKEATQGKPPANLKNIFLALTNDALRKNKAEIEKLVSPYPIKINDQLSPRVFTGEGTPEQVKAALQLASRFQAKLGKYWKDKGSMAESLKDFYWSNIGLNCNGFVGSYARAVGAKQTSDTHVLAYAPAGKRIKKLAQIKPGDVLVWKNGKHIVAIQGPRGDGKFDTVESAGTPEIKGLGASRYELKETGGDVIKATSVNPNTGKKGGTIDVYVASLK